MPRDPHMDPDHLCGKCNHTYSDHNDKGDNQRCTVCNCNGYWPMGQPIQ